MEVTQGQEVIVFRNSAGRRNSPSSRYPGRVVTVKRVRCEIEFNTGPLASPVLQTRSFRLDTGKGEGGLGYEFRFDLPEAVDQNDRLAAARRTLAAHGIQEKWPHNPGLTLDQLEQLAAVAATFPDPEEGP